MIQWVVSIVLLILQISSIGKKIEGVYHAHGKIESSELRIKPNNRFEYFYMLGGCQSTVYGDWELIGKRIILNADEEFLKKIHEELSPVYPRFDQFEWLIKNRGLKPTEEINTGCFAIGKLHKKIK